MFCADYVAAFIFHAMVTTGTVLLFGSKCKPDNSENATEPFDKTFRNYERERRRTALLAFAFGSLGLQSPDQHAKQQQLLLLMESKVPQNRTNQHNSVPVSLHEIGEIKKGFLFPTFAGLTSGLFASITLYPFDFVRGGVLQPGIKRILSAGSTIPYAGVLFGMYFSIRDPGDTMSQIKWAACASSFAVLAEAPLDHAKRVMIGSTRIMVGAGLLYVPFATLMLVMYDKATTKFVEPYLH